VAIRDMERAGIDIITDGEIRRESYSKRFATALSGVDLDNPATGRTQVGTICPSIVQDHVQERAVNAQTAVVFDEP
jgi:5-methyltetrahydropteroyltriglutamate--homocysteine methyltransferase